MSLIGRSNEIKILEDTLRSNKSELIVIYGRRRIGKTYLIRKFYQKNMLFELEGINKIPLKEQLYNFHLKLSKKTKAFKAPKRWLEAFDQLSQFIDSKKRKQKSVIFFDEFPWLHSQRSYFLQAFESFWNSFASKRKDLIIVVCGSAATFMIKNVIKNKGGLHNRLTRLIALKPFNLYETELLLNKNKIKMVQYDILQLYMAFGGVPFYLEKVLPNESVAQAIDRLCFQDNGFLKTEFENVFSSLFENYENHEKIIRTLSQVRKGLTRTEIKNKTKIETGGTLSRSLKDLEQSGFIEKYLPYRGTKDALYRLIDEYCLFFIKFIEKNKTPNKTNVWLKFQNKQTYKIWLGFTFESICLKHLQQITNTLNISGINTTHGSWIEKNDKNGAQIDLLIDRDDNVINLCEIKFTNQKFTINKSYAENITNKINVFKNATKTNKNIFTTFISTHGLKPNMYSKQIVQSELTMAHLFKQ